MGPWLVTQNDNQFSVTDIGELQQLAADGRLTGGDMVQAPGASEWMYAAEVPEIASHLVDTIATEDDDLDYKRGGTNILAVIGVVALLGVIIGGGALGYVMYGMMDTPSQTIVGEGGMSMTQMLVTSEDAALREEPESGGRVIVALPKDSTVDLLAKRGDWYQASTEHGAEGWVSTQDVIPAYTLMGGDATRTYDPLFNPDRYMAVKSASWLQLDQSNTQLTVFRFYMENESDYPMTDLVLLATIKDVRGTELERIEIPVDGVIPPAGVSMVGTLHPAADDEEGVPQLMTKYTFDQLAADDPDLQLRYSDGVEVEMEATDFTDASIDVLQIRAIPSDS